MLVLFNVFFVSASAFVQKSYLNDVCGEETPCAGDLVCDENTWECVEAIIESIETEEPIEPLSVLTTTIAEPCEDATLEPLSVPTTTIEPCENYCEDATLEPLSVPTTAVVESCNEVVGPLSEIVCSTQWWTVTQEHVYHTTTCI